MSLGTYVERPGPGKIAASWRVILGYKLLRAGKSSPALRPLVTDAERWARDSAELAETSEVSKTFTAGDWAVQLDLYSGGDDPEPPTQAIGVAQMCGDHRRFADLLGVAELVAHVVALAAVHIVEERIAHLDRCKPSEAEREQRRGGPARHDREQGDRSPMP